MFSFCPVVGGGAFPAQISVVIAFRPLRQAGGGGSGYWQAGLRLGYPPPPRGGGAEGDGGGGRQRGWKAQL